MSSKSLLSKRDVLSGLRCHKKLWIEFHDEYPLDAKPDAETLMRFAEGRVVGDYARRAAGPGVNIAPGRNIDPAGVEQRTRAAMAEGEPRMFEAGFVAGGANYRADIFERAGDGWAITEVKSAKWPERQRDQEKKLEVHVPDVAVQRWVAAEAGVSVDTARLMYLSRDCRHPDLSNLFTTVDVTVKTEPVVLALSAAVANMHAVLREPVPPDVPVGDQCDEPEECPFYDRCHAPLPPHHVSELYYAKKQAAKLEAEGKTMIADLTEADAPNAPAKRQVRAVKAGRRIVESGLGAALAQLKSPIVYFDFETVQLAVPRWPGCHPQDMVAVQFSAHREGFADNATRFHLAERGGDPRPAIIDAIVEACAGAGSIVVYYEPFEKKRLEELAEWFPDREAELMDIHARVVDLLPIVRDHVYDPDFRGSFSLKKVLPALVKDLGYADLKIQEGGTASAEIYRLLFDASLDAAGQAALRADLLAYCERDTEAMVRLVGVLRGMAT